MLPWTSDVVQFQLLQSLPTVLPCVNITAAGQMGYLLGGGGWGGPRFIPGKEKSR